jgi:hypothetical protein
MINGVPDVAAGRADLIGRVRKTGSGWHHQSHWQKRPILNNPLTQRSLSDDERDRLGKFLAGDRTAGHEHGIACGAFAALICGRADGPMPPWRRTSSGHGVSTNVGQAAIATFNR